MKKWLVLFLLGIYLFVLAFMMELPSGFGWALLILTIVSGCVNVVNAIRMLLNPRKADISMQSIMVFKVCLIPVYLCFLLLTVVFMGLILSVWFAVAGILALPFFIVYFYFVLLTSSSLAIARIITLYRQGILNFSQCVIHILLQLFFMTDVISSIIVNGKERDAGIVSTKL